MIAMGALKQSNFVPPGPDQKRYIESKTPFKIKGEKMKERSEGNRIIRELKSIWPIYVERAEEEEKAIGERPEDTPFSEIIRTQC